MDNFKKQIKKRNRIIKYGLGLLVIFNIFLYIFQRTSPELDHGLSFQMGICVGLIIIGIALIYKYTTALKNDSQLKKLYINEQDERKAMIKQKMCQSALVTFMICLLLMISIVVYLNLTVAYTLIAVVYGLLFIVLGFKIYYSKRY